MRTYCIYGILIYLAAINVAAFFLYGIDKWKAQRNKWRITAHGKLGGYAYRMELKRHLLEWEKSPTETFAMRTNRALQG